MAKWNFTEHYGRLIENPSIVYNDTGTPTVAMVKLDVVRSRRQVGDDLKFIKHDNPIILTKEPEMISEIINWRENDVVFVQGVLCTQKITKSSVCPMCNTKNHTRGNIVYIAPIYARRDKQFEEKRDAVDYIITNSEISNKVYIIGTLVNAPKLFTTKAGKKICQYPVVMERKYRIRTDNVNTKTDYPIVKSYGEQAKKDKMHLQTGAEVMLDGFLQAKSIERNAKCDCCEKFYKWQDNAMEIVPYATEYLTGYRTKEDIEREEQVEYEKFLESLTQNNIQDELDDEMKSKDLFEE